MFIECRHILTNGRKCRAAALRGKPFCFYHAKLHFRSALKRKCRQVPQLGIPDLRDIQVAVNETIATLNSPLTDPRRAGVLLYGLHLAANLQKRIPTADQLPDDSIPPHV